jgi:tetratricopeptide (TPR) repeat protein
MINRFTVYVIFLFFSIGALAQTNREMEQEADALFQSKDFKKAYDLYDKLYTKSPKNFDYKSKLAYCCLYYTEKKARAIELFEDIKRVNKIDAADVDLYLGKAYHLNYRFAEGIKYYEEYIASKPKPKEIDKLFIGQAVLGIMNCKSGLDLLEKKVKCDITNIGPPINTEEVEGVPVITADESVMIFTYNGKKSTGGKLDAAIKPDEEFGEYHEDIFMSVKKPDSTWQEPVGIPSINTKGNDAAVAISPDGQTLFTFASNNDEGDLFVSRLVGSQWTTPERLNNNINTPAWEGSCSLSGDGHYLYFASERPGGIGGRDIWVSEKVNGDWGPPVNMGPSINTIYDEDAPFIHPDGITLFFSSEGHTSIGGYDILFSVKKDNEWQTPRNMGIPLNTTEDDRYYVINAKGTKGFFSSDRSGVGGKGKQDIYMVEPGVLGDKPVIAMLVGTVYGDDKPIEAKIEVYKISSNTMIGPYYSNSTTGKYLFALSPGSEYKIKTSAEGFESSEEGFDMENLDKFREVKKDIYLYSTKNPSVAATATVATTSTTATTPTVAGTTSTTVGSPCNGGPKPDFTPLKGKSLNDITVYKQLLAIGGNYCAEDMIFKVQIAAYRHPENYKYNHLIEFGKPDVKDYPDGITRFTQLEFKTIKEAEVQRQKAIAKGQTDAWIVGFINGKRYTLEELIMLDFLGKSVN